GVGDGLGRGQQRLHLADVKEVAQVIDGGEVDRIADGDGQDLVLERQGQNLVDGGHRLGDKGGGLGLRLELFEVNDLEVVLLGEGGQQLVLVDEAARDRRLAGQLAGVLGLLKDV